MAWNPKLVLYACVAKGIAVLAEYKSPASYEEGGELSEIARRCIKKTPQHHSSFRHTVRGRSYIFLIDESFAYFVIAREDLGFPESLRFLERVREAFNSTCAVDLVKEQKELCCQAKMSPHFSNLISIGKGNEMPSKKNEKTAKVSVPPPGVVLLTKKKRGFEGNVGESRIVFLRKELPLEAAQKGQGGNEQDEKRKMKKMWRMHVWVVLALDLLVCSVLFGIWLGVCEGFKCIER